MHTVFDFILEKKVQKNITVYETKNGNNRQSIMVQT